MEDVEDVDGEFAGVAIPCGHAGAAMLKTSTAATARVGCDARTAGTAVFGARALDRSGMRRGHDVLGMLL